MSAAYMGIYAKFIYIKYIYIYETYISKYSKNGRFHVSAIYFPVYAHKCLIYVRRIYVYMHICTYFHSTYFHLYYG